MSTRVLVVDDTIVFRRIVSEALAAIPGVEVVGVASNGKIAMSRWAALQPDLVTLDIEMPEMNGIEVLQAMGPAGLQAGVIVLSALTTRGGELTMKALELGAFDFVTKPESGSEGLAKLTARLSPIIRAFERRKDVRGLIGATSTPKPVGSLVTRAVTARTPEAPTRRTRRTGPPLVLIGVSTGGPAALAKVLPSLPGNLGAPIFIVQHMPPLFTQALAASLATKCAVRVKEAQDGEIAAANYAYIAPGGKQMKLTAGPSGEAIIHITDDPPELNCKPAVNCLFRSVALNFPGRAIGVILTGMGNDGTEGLKMLKRGGCMTIAQDEASCVVFGMPKEAIQAGVVDTVAPLDMIAPSIVRSVHEAVA